MSHAGKVKRKTRVVPCTDANQRQIAHNALLKKKAAYEKLQQERRLEEIKKFYESLQRQKMSTATVTPNPVDTDSSTETV